MSETPFVCPKCKKPTLSIERGETVPIEIARLFKEKVRKSKEGFPHLKKFLFWKCETCKVYYQTDLKKNLLKKITIEEW